MRIAFALASLAAALSALAFQSAGPQLSGFSARGAATYLEVEKRFLALPDAERIRQAHLYLADQPHMAGTPRDRELAEWTRDQFQQYGLEDVQITTHEVLLPWPEEISVEMTAPKAWRAAMREEPVAGDKYSQMPPAALGLPYHAYAASGEVTAPVVYVGSGNPADYDRLAAEGTE